MCIDTNMHAGQAKSEVPPSALALLESARRGLAAGRKEPSAINRYVASQLAAMRTAAAVVAARSDPRTAIRRNGQQSVWDLLPEVEPSLSRWAAYFSASPKPRPRAAWPRRPHRITFRRKANTLLRNAETFLALAEDTLGVTAQSPNSTSMSERQRGRPRFAIRPIATRRHGREMAVARLPATATDSKHGRGS
jgi:SAV_6107-like HEPN